MPPPPRLRLSSRDCGKQLLEPREGTTTAVGGDILHASHAGAPEQPTLLEGGLAVLGERHLECRQCLLHAWTAPHAAIEVQRPFLPLHPELPQPPPLPFLEGVRFLVEGGKFHAV